MLARLRVAGEGLVQLGALGFERFEFGQNRLYALFRRLIGLSLARFKELQESHLLGPLVLSRRRTLFGLARGEYRLSRARKRRCVKARYAALDQIVGFLVWETRALVWRVNRCRASIWLGKNDKLHRRSSWSVGPSEHARIDSPRSIRAPSPNSPDSPGACFFR
ncbi:MAG: hypothetical protein ACR650_00175 [Methylocystis sp.]